MRVASQDPRYKFPCLLHNLLSVERIVEQELNLSLQDAMAQKHAITSLQLVGGIIANVVRFILVHVGVN